MHTPPPAPCLADAIRELRAQLGDPAAPIGVVVTGSADERAARAELRAAGGWTRVTIFTAAAWSRAMGPGPHDPPGWVAAVLAATLRDTADTPPDRLTLSEAVACVDRLEGAGVGVEALRTLPARPRDRLLVREITALLAALRRARTHSEPSAPAPGPAMAGVVAMGPLSAATELPVTVLPRPGRCPSGSLGLLDALVALGQEPSREGLRRLVGHPALELDESGRTAERWRGLLARCTGQGVGTVVLELLEDPDEDAATDLVATLRALDAEARPLHQSGPIGDHARRRAALLRRWARSSADAHDVLRQLDAISATGGPSLSGALGHEVLAALLDPIDATPRPDAELTALIERACDVVLPPAVLAPPPIVPGSARRTQALTALAADPGGRRHLRLWEAP